MRMTRLELLTCAAIAVGFDFIADAEEKGIWIMKNGEQPRRWNPLRNNGEALILASEKNLHVDISHDQVSVWNGIEEDKDANSALELIDRDDPDACRSIRLAIVRAVAGCLDDSASPSSEMTHNPFGTDGHVCDMDGPLINGDLSCSECSYHWEIPF